ncbi:venom carboxylesterase-6-like [Ctenocephalides felis]|uniref:venom carboxylesterase-6-like n=1 Tax=Ctenocephalides felis TaxID=7515 RepID=UPI000E6E22B3|nr:venom carboxylesterase-6-like [Ctenocephalides felis]
MQYGIHSRKLTGDEDCLFLNVYTPKLSNIADESKLPVMVFIHGGGFQSGSGSSISYEPDWLIEQDIVLVTINYRCGVMGFLSLNIPEAPGNVGLKDQVAALKWVQKNIRSFGGDPDNVTVFGQSAGGASVNYLLLSKLSKNLFHKGISMSGSALNPWAHILNGEENAIKLSKSFGFSETDKVKILKFLQTIPPRKLYEVIGQTPGTTVMADYNKFFRDLVFLPTIEKRFHNSDEPFLDESPMTSLKKGQFHNIPYMAGYTNKEGIFALIDGLLDPFLFGLTDENFERYIPEELCLDIKTADIVASEIRDFYYGNRPVSINNTQDFISIKGETWFNTGIEDTIRLVAEKSTEPVYYYMFSFDEFSVPKKINHQTEYEGATHCQDLFYLFKHQEVDLPRNITSVENMRKQMVKMYTDFAKTGNPIPEKSNLLPITWKPVTNRRLHYLDINSNLQILENPYKKNMDYWHNLKEKYNDWLCDN